ncbi:MAG: YajQ family cyclic di-GMP-binding protein [Proteobacteria bacterium]|nr:MAG: YajQ family cyclic di-GMP-binding protein [Pseudomonadota bacterium]
MPSFDVVSIVNSQEVKNAIDQVQRELTQRYDFKGSKSSVELKDIATIEVVADDTMKLQAIQELMRQKFAKRGVSNKSVKFSDPIKGASDTLRQEVRVKQGLTDEELKRLNKSIKDLKIKVTAQIQGDQLRVSGKKRDDLQGVIAALRNSIQDIDLQFVNFRD